MTVTANPGRDRPLHRSPDRHLDRIASAGLRAVAAEPKAEIRGRRLEVDDKPLLVVVPYLALVDRTAGNDRTSSRLDLRRGVMDGLGLRIRHSDPALHLELSPRSVLQRVIFDIAEQFRCESLVDSTLPGVKVNTAAAFEEWSDTARAARVDETGVGLLVFTITHMLRARLLRVQTSESVDEIIETTRGNLGKLVGHALKVLPSLVDDQRAFAVPAAEIARLVAEMVEDAEASENTVPESVTDNALLIPIDWDLLEELTADESKDGPAAEPDQRYHATAHDRVVTGEELYRRPVLRKLRTELDGHVAAQAVSVARLAQRLQRLFPVLVADGWSGGEEEGLLDPSRLAQLVADPGNRLIHRRERLRPSSDAVVGFLVDTSGSMKLQRHESVAVLVDTLCRALEAAGSTSEVLGFTTGAWGGGRVMADWRAAGSPDDPGRLNEVQHIVYKHAEQPWRQARLGLAAMLRTDHYREGVDGEAIQWAYGRLLQRPERRKILVIISDGAPMDAATAGHNRAGFLADHLRSVAREIETAARVELGAVGIDQQLDEFVAKSVSLDLTGTLSIGSYDVLHRLFAHR